jgi:hypothetical protein
VRRIRGIIGMAITWGCLWVLAGGFLGTVLVLSGASHWGLPTIWWSAIWFGMVGVLGGGAFAVILSVAERRSVFDDLKVRRIALIGTAGALAALAVFVAVTAILAPDTGLSGNASADLILSGGIAALGAGSSAGTLMLARRAPKGLGHTTRRGGLTSA